MNRKLVGIAVIFTVLAFFLPVRHQQFTRVAVNGHVIRMLVAGDGEATVVFENGLGPPLEIWGKVQPEVSRFARTVSYDRAGVGLSEVGPSPRDGRRIASELHQALRAAGLPPPYVLVGHSFGGLCIRVFAGIYAQDVSAMVLVDPMRTAEEFGPSTNPEVNAVRDTVEQAQASQVPVRIPLVLIDAISPREVPFATSGIRQSRAKLRPGIEAESRAYEAWLETIPGARLIVTHQSGHNVPVEQPGLVVEAIRQVIREIGLLRR